jgi:hypothetical protein
VSTENWSVYDPVAQRLFDILGSPASESYFDRKIWTIELELDEVRTNIDESTFPAHWREIFNHTLKAFYAAIDEEKHSDIRRNTNHFTLAYRFYQWGNTSGWQWHELSIGQPYGTGEAWTRFSLKLIKSSGLITSHSLVSPYRSTCAWIQKQRRVPGCIVINPPPADFYKIGHKIFSEVVNEYYRINGSPTPETLLQFVHGGPYGPAGILE